MRMRAIGFMAGTLAIILPLPSPAQQIPRDQPGQRSEDLLDRLDEAHIRAELLEMEVATDKKMVQKMMEVLLEARLRRGDQPEERKPDIDSLSRMLEEVRADFVKQSLELRRARRLVAELEGRVGRPEATKVSNAKGRIKAIERMIDEILKEVGD